MTNRIAEITARCEAAMAWIEHQEKHDISAEALKTSLADIPYLLEKLAEREKGCVWCRSDSQVTHNGEHFCFFCSYCGKRLEVKHEAD